MIDTLGEDERAVSFIRQARKDKYQLFFSVITECEILSGVKSDDEMYKILLFTDQMCIEVDSRIARWAGKLRREQKQKGRKLKTPDAFIIATAYIYSLSLVSRDSDMKFVQEEYDIPFVYLTEANRYLGIRIGFFIASPLFHYKVSLVMRAFSFI